MWCAMRVATGGSTNSVLHIPALARQVGCDITPETFDYQPSGAGHQHHLSEPPHLYHGGV
ncbi:MAG: dihydroxy-acid dehydratase [Ruthenibacterium lactatiformans]